MPMKPNENRRLWVAGGGRILYVRITPENARKLDRMKDKNGDRTMSETVHRIIKNARVSVRVQGGSHEH